MATGDSLLIGKLDAFIRKYYLNKIIRGGLLSIGLLLVIFLSFILIEHFGHFGIVARTVLFYLLLSSICGSVGYWVVVPLVRLWNIADGLKYEDAAKIIGKHFPMVQDKLLNTLQLQESVSMNGSELLFASIDQRMAELRPIPFVSAIDLSQNKRFLRYALPPFLLLLLLSAIYPALVRESTKRIVLHRTAFENLVPFRFEIQNQNLSTIEQKDFDLSVRLIGDEIPNDLYIVLDDKRILMSKDRQGSFGFTFRQPRESTVFQFSGGGYQSSEYQLEVLPKPSLNGFTVSLDYPNYLGMEDELRSNTGDLLIPAGTKVSWDFNTSQTDVLSIILGSTNASTSRTGDDSFSFSQRFISSSEYCVILSNRFSRTADSVRYTVSVIPDLYPTVAVSAVEDSLNPKRIYFNGLTKDDHGFSRLTFHYSKIPDPSANGGLPLAEETSIVINTRAVSHEFFHFWDLTSLGLQPGESVEYYFEVWDNDAVNGSKSARTEKRVFRMSTLAELADENDSKSDQIKDELADAMKMAEKMKKGLNDIQKDLLEKQNLSWEDKEKMKELIEMQKQLQKEVEQIQQQSEQKNSKMNEMMQFEPTLVEKQKQLERLFEEVMTEDMKKLFDEMERLMEELTKDKAQELLDEMKFSNEDLEKELDRSLELFKQLEFEQKMGQTIQRLEDLAEKQEQLSEDTKQKKEDNETLSERQEELNKEFDDIQKDLDDLEQKNQELEKPNEMESLEDEQKSVEQNQENSQEQLQQEQNKKASESQQNAADQMQKMAQKMGNMMMQMQAQSQEEDLDALRQIVENLLTLSFDEEALISNLKKTNHNDPKYTELAREQQKLRDDSKLIEDSLFALSKRVPQIETVVNREIRSINSNMLKAIEKLADRRIPEAVSRQQFALTSLNNLALMLSETVQQMQQAMASQMSGSGSCSKPGNSKSPSAASMRKLQEQLNQQLEQMKKGMKPGGQESGIQPGGSKPGTKGMSREMAKMAAQQEALRNMAREYESQLKKEEGGKGSGGEMKRLQELMEKTETDLVNKTITQETLMRQQEILSRLLEAEKAEREREQEQRRESKESKNEDFGNPEIFFEYIRRKNNETELLRTVPPNLNPYFRDMVDDYFRKQAD